MTKSKTKQNEQPQKAASYWNARWRRAGDDNEKHWKPIRVVSRAGLECDIIEGLTGATRTVSLQFWEIEVRGRGPRGGETWTDVVLIPEEDLREGHVSEQGVAGGQSNGSQAPAPSP